ncbi:uncharacterized protein MYCFIDRAFT_174065 [Pseudocercospora fijiensis CIRAD86]|uniref:Uncharacterized protein n=1 Tax=Pseudocercospora fijiensis (strain CIRAD86) TaxID=383855 RepID=M2Z633_PSEFD|nr:uncharacterized protein MYCFIDRAFT_174065 [Pseudocercospora fijiensis CIRAD86]EME85235.1 hypothetical protein MYCFIDRAFT_174065 [Pseudocercospora fijiensis CIRAD86]
MCLYVLLVRFDNGVGIPRLPRSTPPNLTRKHSTVHRAMATELSIFIHPSMPAEPTPQSSVNATCILGPEGSDQNSQHEKRKKTLLNGSDTFLGIGAQFINGDGRKGNGRLVMENVTEGLELGVEELERIIAPRGKLAGSSDGESVMGFGWGDEKSEWSGRRLIGFLWNIGSLVQLPSS